MVEASQLGVKVELIRLR